VVVSRPTGVALKVRAGEKREAKRERNEGGDGNKGFRSFCRAQDLRGGVLSHLSTDL
jgi:hypothetical protein